MSPGHAATPPAKETTMRDDALRIAAYISKTTPTTVGLKVAAQLAGMKTGFSGSMTGPDGIVATEMKVQGILNAWSTPTPIPTIDYPFYMNFARQVFARRRKGVDGTGLTAIAQAYKDYWTDLGYLDTLLVKIALDCFTLTLT
jgi:hypothetical protein